MYNVFSELAFKLKSSSAIKPLMLVRVTVAVSRSSYSMP